MPNMPTQLVATGVTSRMMSYNKATSVHTAFSDVRPTGNGKELMVDEDYMAYTTTSREVEQ